VRSLLLCVVKSEPHQPLVQQAAQAEEHSLFVSLETYRCLLRAVDLLRQDQALDVTALRQTLEEPQPQELLLVEHQALVDVQVEGSLQLVQDSLAQDRTAQAVTLAEAHTQQVYSTTQTYVLAALVALAVEDSQTATLQFNQVVLADTLAVVELVQLQTSSQAAAAAHLLLLRQATSQRRTVYTTRRLHLTESQSQTLVTCTTPETVLSS
jgi:hypothetical protein